MREIIPHRLWLGNAYDAANLTLLLDTNIEAIIALALEEPAPKLTRELMYLRFPLIDGDGNRVEVIAAAIDAIACLIEKQIPALVACSAGMSLSPALTAAALALVQSKRPEQCLSEIITGQPHDVSPLLWQTVMEAYHLVKRRW